MTAGGDSGGGSSSGGGARLEHDWFPRPVPGNVVIGPRSWCYSAFAFAHCRSRRARAVRIGSDSGIYNGTFFELGPEGQVEVGDFCTLVGAIVCTNRRVVIEDHAFVAHEVVLADGPFATPEGVVGGARGGGGGGGGEGDDRPAIVVGRNSWIAARAVLLAGARIGEGAIVGAAAVVDFEVPAHAVVAGSPARIVGWARPQG